MIARALRQIREVVETAIDLIEKGDMAEAQTQLAQFAADKAAFEAETAETNNVRVVEGVFDGQAMIGSDSKQYPVPPNYASKSKLVEGDVLKLTIRNDGSFVYKQIGPTERRRYIGTLIVDPETGDFAVETDDGKFRVLTASVTYYKGGPGDEAIIMVPKAGSSAWAAVENIIKK